MSAWSSEDWLGTAEQCEEIHQFARNYNWEDTAGMIDPEYAADAIIAALAESEELHPNAEEKLHGALIASAERENARRA